MLGEIIRIYPGYGLKPFDCGDADLNDYFQNDCLVALNKLTAVTYVIESAEETIGFMSLLNDKITTVEISGADFQKIKEETGKIYKSQPAVKIGRLAITSNIQKQGTGTAMIDYVKQTFVTNNRTGCRYITVDAYRQSIGFYEKNGFRPLTADKGLDTLPMYFDLQPIYNAIHC